MTIKFFEPSMADKIGFAITMIIVLLMFIGFEVKNWWEDHNDN